MEQVTLYSESHELQRTDAQYVLETYFRFIKWDNEINSKILDIGCGDGDVTLHLLLPKIPRNFKELIATDILDDMLVFAKEKCKDSRVSFQKFDVSCKNLPKDFEEQFDHVFSFYCLHWIQNHRYCIIYNIFHHYYSKIISFLTQTSNEKYF